MKNYHYIFLFSILLFSCCKEDCPDNPKEGNTYTVYQDDISWLLPYKDFDTIRFLRNNQDTLIFTVGKIEHTYYKELNQEPCPRLDKMEWLKQEFTDRSGSGYKITLNYYTLSPVFGRVKEYYITFSNSTYGPVAASDMFGCTEKVSFGGNDYTGTCKLNSGNDYLYYGHRRGVLKFINQNDIYEKIP